MSFRPLLHAGAVLAAALISIAVPAAQNQGPPRNLKPLLAKPASELRLVVTRYNADRSLLNTNFAGPGGFNMPGGRGGRGRGRGAAPGETPAARPRPVPLSTARLARLKRFDLDWQAALKAIPRAGLSPAAVAEFEILGEVVSANLGRLEAENLELAQMAPALPFAPRLVALIEARIRVADIDSQEAARTLTEVKNGLLATMAAPPQKLNAATAARAAEATETLRTAITEWFNFYNGYDPVFTWWMGMPYKHVDKALQDYAAFVRDKVADENTRPLPAKVAPIQPAPAHKYASVPDLAEIIALPQDELRDIVGRFNAEGPRRGGRGGGRGGPPAAEAPAAPRNNRGWLAALKSLDFDKLSRNAQVDYLYIKWRAETEGGTAGGTEGGTEGRWASGLLDSKISRTFRS